MDADKYAVRHRKLLLSKSNAFRKEAKEKEKLISDLDNQRLELIKKRDSLISLELTKLKMMYVEKYAVQLILTLQNTIFL